MSRRDNLVLGRIAGVHGVRGWLKVYSYTDPRENIFGYAPWTLMHGGSTRDIALVQSRVHAGRLLAKLDGIDDRDAAATWVGADIATERSRLPATAADEFYWADLIGLTVETVGGEVLGRVDRVLETGANDVLVVTGSRQRLIPWLPGRVIESVNLDDGTIRVDWDPEF